MRPLLSLLRLLPPQVRGKLATKPAPGAAPSPSAAGWGVGWATLGCGDCSAGSFQAEQVELATARTMGGDPLLPYHPTGLRFGFLWEGLSGGG